MTWLVKAFMSSVLEWAGDKISYLIRWFSLKADLSDRSAEAERKERLRQEIIAYRKKGEEPPDELVRKFREASGYLNIPLD